MRSRTLALSSIALLALIGCGGETATDPKSLPPLTAEDHARIKERDTKIEDEEANSVRAEAPKKGRAK